MFEISANFEPDLAAEARSAMCVAHRLCLPQVAGEFDVAFAVADCDARFAGAA